MRDFLPEIKYTFIALIAWVFSIQNITEVAQMIAAIFSAMAGAIAFYKAFTHRFKTPKK